MKAKGMTLLELLVVIAIIGVLAAIGLPAFHLMSRGTRLTNASRMITETLSAARQMAITQKVYSYESDGFRTIGERARYVDFDVPLNRFRITFWTKKDGQRYKKISLDDWQTLPDGVEFLGEGDYHYPPDYIRFTSSGIAYNSDIAAPTIFDFAIIDRSSGEGQKAKTRVITVQGVTGMAKAEAK